MRLLQLCKKGGLFCIIFCSLCLIMTVTVYASNVEQRKQAIMDNYSLIVEEIDKDVWDEDVALTMLEEALLKYPKELLREMFAGLTEDGTNSITTAKFIKKNPNNRLVIASWTPVDNNVFKMEFMPETTADIIVHELAHCLDHYFQLKSKDKEIITHFDELNEGESYTGLRIYEWDMSKKQESAFISKYAATSVFEDWAEIVTGMATASPKLKNHLFWEPNGSMAKKVEYIYSLGDKYINSNINLREFWNILQYTVESPSPWAVPFYERAVNEGIIPHKEGFIGSHTQIVSRLDFCYLIAELIETHTGKIVADYAEEKGFAKLDYTQVFEYTDKEKGTDDPNYPFNDIYEPDIYYLYKLGVISGKGDGVFAPQDGLTREEAAVILANTAKALGKSIVVIEQEILDKADISFWAKEGVDFSISADFMTSVGGNLFAPKDKLTYEQAYTAVLRLKDVE